MALRSPTYLDTETLLSLAEYFDLDVPHQADVVEKTVRKLSGGGKIGASGAGTVVIGPGDQDALTKDGVVELKGCARITTASVAGKVLFIFRRLMGGVEGHDLKSILSLDDEELPPGTVEQL